MYWATVKPYLRKFWEPLSVPQSIFPGPDVGRPLRLARLAGRGWQPIGWVNRGG